MSDAAVLKAKIEEYRAALAQDPKSKVFVALSDAYRAAGQLDDALEVALRGTWELPQYAEGFAAVGRVYAQRKVVRKAEEAFYRALSLDQMCIPAYKGLAALFRNQGEIQKASDILTKAIMLDPGDPSLQKMIESLAMPAAPAQRSPAADVEPVVDQETAMTQKSGSMKPITTATIADIYIEQGLYDKALEVYRELLAERPQDAAVQQKISELEALMSSTGAAPAAPAPATAASGAGDSETVIEKLNGWLAAIQARRNRV